MIEMVMTGDPAPEPVAVVTLRSESPEYLGDEPPIGTLLYAAPVSAEPVNARLLEAMKKAREEMAIGNFNSASERITHAIAAAEQTNSQQIHEIRLFDSQWTNVVNHDNCYSGYSIEDAVNKAVKLTEIYMSKNFRDDKWPVSRGMDADKPEPLTDERIAEIAHRKATSYRHIEKLKYRFSDTGIVDFARAIEREVKGGA